MKYRIITGKPVPADLYDELVAMGCGRDITITSCLRTGDAVSWARGQGYSLSSQQELWDGFRSGRPGFNPANPPGKSTHELRNDGAAYAGWAGMPLRYWQVGIDNSNSPLLCQRARERGWIATLTYPGSRSELHHVNFRREPKISVFRPLKRGSRGPRVAAMSRGLQYLGYVRTHSKRGTGRFSAGIEEALKSFQRDHHLKADGVYGKHTAAQLRVTNRGKKRCRQAAMKKHGKARQKALDACGRKYGPQQ